MENTVSIYKKFEITEITYEVGDNTVKANCELHYDNGNSVQTSILISHSDLNRIIARIATMGFEFNVEQVNNFLLEDGTQIIDYKLENVFGESVVVEDFQFQDVVKQIRA
ncbi:MAG: hypothetical protein MK078_02950 [Crocinitomicaceae bacterium]|nr:hypothetical protein [Crocinitomicaceae bacterium]